jgi:Tol biopolymer transport system component
MRKEKKIFGNWLEKLFLATILFIASVGPANAVYRMELIGEISIQSSTALPFDWDGDNIDELVVGTGDSTCIWKVFDFQSGSFAEVFSKDEGACYRTHAYSGDTDSDNQLELLIQTDNADGGGFLKIFENSGPGSWSEVWSQSFSTLRTPRNIFVGDPDNDGKNEIVIGEDWYDRQLYVYEHNGGNNYSGTLLESGKDYHSVCVGDADNDGQNELAMGTGLYDASGRTVGIWEYSAGSYTKVFSQLINGDQSEIAIGDLDNDGKNEILQTRGGGGAGNYYGFAILKWNGATYNVLYSNTTIDCTFRPLIGDLFNSGSNQFALIGDNQVDIMEYSSGSTNPICSLPLGQSTNWGSEGISFGDVNGDGKGEFITSHVSSGVKIYKGTNIDLKNIILYEEDLGNGYNLWAMSLDTQFKIQLTNENLSDWIHARISPDGRKIAYRSSVSGRPEVWVMNIDGSNKQKVTDSNSYGWAGNTAWDGLNWAPDSQTIIFSAQPSSPGPHDLYKIRFNSTGLQAVITNGKDNGGMDWHPGKNKLVVCKNTPYNAYDAEIYIANPDGTGLTCLTSTSGNSHPSWASWTPDGSKIVYDYTDHTVSPSQNDIYIMNPDGTNQTNLTPGTSSTSQSSRKPFLDKIYYTSNISGSNEIWVMGIDGGNKSQLTNVGSGSRILMDVGSYLYSPQNAVTAADLNNNITLNWEKSPTPDIGKYNIYWDNGTGSMNYATPIATVLAGESLTHTTGILTGGTNYCFVVRAAKIAGNEDSNTNQVCAFTAEDPCAGGIVKMMIADPLPGKRVNGNRLLVRAGELSCGSIASVSKVLFQYKAEASGVWLDIPAAVPANHPNPDTSDPYFIHWDVTGLAEGNYHLRAVAYNLSNQLDLNPAYVTIQVDHNRPQKTGSEVEGEMLAVDEVYAGKSNQLKSGRLDIDGIDELNIPENALASDTSVSYYVEDPADHSGKCPPSKDCSAGEYRQIILHSGQSSLNSGNKAQIKLSYKDNDNNGIVDGTTINATELKTHRWISGTDWEELASTVDTGKKQVIFETDHFSLFGLFPVPAPVGGSSGGRSASGFSCGSGACGADGSLGFSFLSVLGGIFLLRKRKRTPKS